MSLLRLIVAASSIVVTMLGVGWVAAQDYPSKPVRIIALGVGSANDFVTRLIAQGLTANVGQQVIVENQPIYVSLALAVAKAPPDGYTLLSTGAPTWTLPLLQKTPYDPLTDFLPITSIARSLNVLVVHPSLPVNSVKELVSLAKAKPGALNYASGGTGGPGHLTGELFKALAGVNIVHVAYKGGSAAISDLITGQVQIAFDNPSTVMPLVKAGKLRALAVTTAEPSSLVPGLPTVAATGLPGFEATQMNGMFAPAKTPEAVIRRLNQEVVRVLSTADMKEKYLARGIEVVHSSPAEFTAAIKAEMAKWSKVIKEANIKAD